MLALKDDCCSERTVLLLHRLFLLAMQSLLPARSDSQSVQTLSMYKPPCEEHEARQAFTKSTEHIVQEVVQAIAFITDNTVRLYRDRRGWQIRGILPIEDPQFEEWLLSVSKQLVLLQCQQAKHVCLLNCCTHPWKDTNHGFRALLGCVEDRHTACIPMYETGRCFKGANCSNNHPVCIKRLFVTMHTPEHSESFDDKADATWECNTFSCGTSVGDVVSEQNASVSTMSQSTIAHLSSQGAALVAEGILISV